MNHTSPENSYSYHSSIHPSLASSHHRSTVVDVPSVGACLVAAAVAVVAVAAIATTGILILVPFLVFPQFSCSFGNAFRSHRYPFYLFMH